MASHTGRPRVATRLTIALALLGISTIGHAQATDLTQVYERARDHDAAIQAAAFDFEAARERVPQARSALLPQLSAGAEGSYTQLIDQDIDGDDDFTGSTLSLTLGQTLFNQASNAQLGQAETSVMQAEAQFRAEEQNLILRVATAYFDVLRAQANVEFSESELEAISRQREQAERRFDVGLVPITDVREAEAQYDLAVSQEIVARNQLSTAREALRFISGVEQPDTLAVLADDLPLAAPEPADAEAWVATATDQNLPLIIARFTSEAARQQIAVERGARYPTLDLTGALASVTSDQPESPEGESAELRLTLNLPLYTGGRTSSLVTQARAESLAASERLVEQERTTMQQTRDAYRAVIATISQVRALRQALVSTRQSADATEAGFRAGTRTSVDVLQSLRDTFRAQSDYAGARYDYLVNTLNLRFAAGTLNDEDLTTINRFLSAPESDSDSEGESDADE